ncbi:MAG: ribonucleoside triphosphate reductase [Candidatus Omnitrophica bacterium]|nr:ribonucleoside triphosphate reductase [Candidatus Omnitrophota bacterium]MCM8806727.1 ribonucleoside triphosphate reductase [Candidatus Omnitrophota bacterium]
MFKKIVKRDGRIVDFDSSKITNAIFKAGQATGEFGMDTAKKLTIKVLDLALELIKNRIPTVEEIQDIVEEVLLNSPYKKTAKAYIIYREQHAKIREITAKANLDLVDQYLKQSDWRVKENSNMSFSLQGLNNYISSEITKTYWLNSIYPPEIRKAYIEGDFHIHDLGCLSVYCVGWDLQDLLLTGFKGAEGKVESSPAKHFGSALGQIVNFFYTLQGEAAGAQAFSNFDTLLAPFVRYDGLSYKEVKQAIQEFLFNVNVPTRTGFQTPFTNLTFDLKVPEIYKDQPVIIGGEFQNLTYGDFQKEMDMINKAFFEVMLEGDAKGRVFTFPIPTYNITKDFEWNNEIFDLLWEITGKYGIPYFSNFINSDLKPEDVRSMCCRLRLQTDELKKKGGGLFGANPLTGSIGVVTINLPRIGYLSKTKEEFKNRLNDLMELAKESLEIKRKILERFTDEGLYPYSKFYLRNIKERFGKYWVNHFSTIGIIGMNEACLNLFGKDIGDPESIDFAIEIMEFMREKLIKFQESTGNIYNLEATPAEGTSYRLAKIDKSKFPDIIVANEHEYRKGAEPFYTNSTHLPVNYTDDIFEVLEKQDKLQSLYTGGTVIHIFVGERINSKEGIKKLVKTICENFSLPYFTITPTFSVCPMDGYLSGEFFNCPKCGKNTEVYSRIVGYLRPVSQWNKGKFEEFKLRKTFVLK